MEVSNFVGQGYLTDAENLGQASPVAIPGEMDGPCRIICTPIQCMKRLVDYLVIHKS